LPTKKAKIGETLPLLASRRPTAIAGLVIALLIDSIDAVLRRRPAAHVGEEIGKARAPAITNFDAASAAFFPTRVAWPCASANHA
jgi:hypothetical protein